MILKWTNAVQMPLVLTLRAHTIALVIPRTYVGNGFECKGSFGFLQTFQLVKAVLEITCCLSGGHCRPTQIQILLN